MDELAGHFGNLSMQKCGSHVVEHCLKLAPRLICDRIINELMHDPKLLDIILDQYGNFVIQTALKQCQVKILYLTLCQKNSMCNQLMAVYCLMLQGEQHAAFVETIKPHTGVMQSNMYGKKVLSRICLKNKHCRFDLH